MSLPVTARSRLVVLSAALLAILAAGLLFSHHLTRVQAAKIAVVDSDPRVLGDPSAPGANPTPASTTAAPSAATPVLVELFTSEGCSSCPPADALLARLQHDQPVPAAEVLALEEHVDYWDYLGWHDRFASHDITARQSAYAHTLRLDDDYTPQMIVDGTDQFVGNDTAAALRTIARAARTPKLNLTLSPIAVDGNRLTGTVSVAPAPDIPRNADLYAVVVEPMASTKVLRGENGGHTLSHASVVRSLQRIGTLGDAAAAPLHFSLDTPKDAVNPRIIVFAQRPNQGAILAAISGAP